MLNLNRILSNKKSWTFFKKNILDNIYYMDVYCSHKKIYLLNLFEALGLFWP